MGVDRYEQRLIDMRLYDHSLLGLCKSDSGIDGTDEDMLAPLLYGRDIHHKETQ
jgi:hypothetical protein